MKKHIHIFAMKTWGELGNLLAANTLANSLISSFPEYEIKVIEAEDLFPRFKDIGLQIKALTDQSPTPMIRNEKYFQLFDQLNNYFFKNFEITADLPAELETELKGFVEYLNTHKPYIVFGTKGIISRILLAASKRSQAPPMVINYLTNHGLLLLDIHCSKHIPLNLIQFSISKDYLQDTREICQNQISVVGPLISKYEYNDSQDISKTKNRKQLLDEFNDNPQNTEKPFVCVFCNRGYNEQYLLLCNYIAQHYPEIAFSFIAYKNPDLLAEISGIKSRYQLDHWELFENLSQQNYFNQISRLSNSPFSFLITKPGPNTLLEAISFGIPLLILNSGLPMEQWIIDVFDKNRLAKAFDNMDDLVAKMNDWLQNPQKVLEYKIRAIDFRDKELNQHNTSNNIKRAIEKLIS
jgi:Glycosyl transferases group 1